MRLDSQVAPDMSSNNYREGFGVGNRQLLLEWGPEASKPIALLVYWILYII